jgi:hypothetical protein
LSPRQSIRLSALLGALVMSSCFPSSNTPDEVRADAATSASDDAAAAPDSVQAPEDVDTPGADAPSDDTAPPGDVEPSADTTSPADTSVGADEDTTSPLVTCGGAEDCGWCVFGAAPATVADCTCPACPTAPMPRATCEANHRAWDRVCGGDAWHATANCPQPRCTALPELTCNEGRCEPGCDPTRCPALPCPAAEQQTPPGECCPRCMPQAACGADRECVMCAFPNLVNAPSECRCIFCPSHPMTREACDANTASWKRHCDPWPKPDPCPVASCLPQAAPVCDAAAGVCVKNPNSCTFDDDCGSCLFLEAPTTAADCRCPMCPGPLNQATCEANQAAVADVCSGFDFAACPIPSCAEPPPVGCVDGNVCGHRWDQTAR